MQGVYRDLRKWEDFRDSLDMMERSPRPLIRPPASVGLASASVRGEASAGKPPVTPAPPPADRVPANFVAPGPFG